MLSYGVIISIFTMFVSGTVIYYQKKRTNELIRKDKIESDAEYIKCVEDMKILTTIVTNKPENYFNLELRKSLEKKIDKVLLEIEKYNIKTGYYGYNELYTLKNIRVDIKTIFAALNTQFINNELRLYEELFDNVNGIKLDEEQRRSIVIDELNNLVIAGAGSGKTLTILGKIQYLIKRGIKSEEILLISFTKKSADELNEKVKNILNANIYSATFHKLGLDIITSFNKKRPNVFEDKNLIVEKYFSEELLLNPKKMADFLSFVGCYLNIPNNLNSETSLGKKFENEKIIDLETLQSKLLKEKKSLNGERVKSVEELIIANYLFLNGIKYKYEGKYPYTGDVFKKAYKPDFYLIDYDIYIEHFGISRDKKCPWLSQIEEKKYLGDIEYKRSLHYKHKTKLLETYSYYQSEGILIEKLEELLISNNVEMKCLSNDKLKKVVNSLTNEYYLAEFVKLCATFITLFKSQGFDQNYFKVLNKKFEDLKKNNEKLGFICRREEKFLQIAEDMFKYYQDHLEREKEIDFADMINNATHIVEQNGVNTKYKYIIIDEYQDIGADRFKLIKAIIKKTNAHIMAVGDDWQSIYRFAGSDVNLITNFENHWGESVLSKIQTTYRNSQALINIAGKFVMENTNQIRKTLRSFSNVNNIPEPLQLRFYKQGDDNDINDLLEKTIKEITKEYGEKLNILLLGRNNFDIDIFVKSKNFTYNSRTDKIIYKTMPKLDIKFLTVHRSKGLEGDNVIILNNKNDRLGFPNKIADDPVLQLLLPEQDNFEFAEERRLFYVALTRTKNKVFLLSPDKNVSQFAEEINKSCAYKFDTNENLLINNPTCPKCKTGRLLIRKNSKSEERFVGCSNYPQCDFTSKNIQNINRPIICSQCGGFMTKRKGKHGAFYACENYPECTNTKQIN